MFSQYHRFKPESISCTSVHDQQGKSYNIKTVSRLVFSIQIIIRLTHDVFLILLFRIVCSLNQFHVLLLMIIKVNVALLRQFLVLYCLSKLIITLTHNVILI